MGYIPTARSVDWSFPLILSFSHQERLGVLAT